MARIALCSGIVGDYDGAYDWVKKSKYDDSDYSVGWHLSNCAGESYVVIEIPDNLIPEYPKVKGDERWTK